MSDIKLKYLLRWLRAHVNIKGHPGLQVRTFVSYVRIQDEWMQVYVDLCEPEI